MAKDLVTLTPRAQWVHYSSCPDQIVIYDTDYSNAKGEHGYFKPIGLWITPYGQEDNWFEWSMSEEFRISELNYIHDVELAAAANILRITSVEGLDAFSNGVRNEPFLQTRRHTRELDVLRLAASCPALRRHCHQSVSMGT